MHLAGKNVATRWTPSAKREILSSRVQSTKFIANAISTTRTGPKIFVCASAIGFYGSRGEELLIESSGPGKGFLAEVCQQWEAAAKVASPSARVVCLRTGIVLSTKGGALAKMLPAFRLGIGGRIGSGRQWMSWISIDDEVNAIRFAIEQQTVSGAINLVAPNPVTNAEFTETLGRVLHRPTFLSVPAFAIRLALGEMGEATLLASDRVLPAVLAQSGFHFQNERLESALRAELEGK